MKLNNKIAIMGACSVLLTAIALILLAVWQSREYNSLAQEEVNKLIESELNHITQGIYNLVHTENEAVQSQIDNNLKIARYILENSGSVELGEEDVGWDAINQFTQEAKHVRLPKMLVNSQWLQKNKSFNQKTPIVDEVSNLVGETATIFQRMNEQGDMLRVATTVKTVTNNRAISTYIPAVNPDGSGNPVVATILRGDTYHGRAYVVNDWYLTTYEPIYNDIGTIIGMLYVGTKQQTVAARIRSAILQTSVGKTGYVYVISGRGQDRGKYIISQRGERDGEDIWTVRDFDDQLIIQNIINKAIKLDPGSMTTVRYRWKNSGDPKPRWKIARLAYYAPWDWVIGISVYEDEIQSYRNVLINGRIKMIRSMMIAGSIITLLIVLIAMYVVWVILHPVKEMTATAQKIIDGDHFQSVQVRSQDEIGILARTFNQMSQELHQAIDSLRESEEKYRNIFEYSPEGLFQSTLEGRLISANSAAAIIFGYDTPEKMIAEMPDITTLLYTNPRDRHVLFDSISTNQDISNIEVQCHRNDGQKIWVVISAHMPTEARGQEKIIYGFVRNITGERQAEAERRSLESRLVQSQKMEAMGTLAGGIAHDFNNILGGIIGYSELIEMFDIENQVEVKRKIGKILCSAYRAKDLVNQILAFSRKIDAEFEVVSLSRLINEALIIIRASAPSFINIDFFKKTENDLICCDPTQIHQVLLNMCVNAVDSMSCDGGQLTITLREAFATDLNNTPAESGNTEGYVVTEISDTGCGVNPDQADRIFEPFYTTKAPGEGTGMGLALVYGILKTHHSYISVKSTPHQGSAFTLIFSRNRQLQQQSQERDEAVGIEISEGGNRRILLVDDEENILSSTTEFLQKKAYNVVHCKSSAEALEVFYREPKTFDLVITDETMPEITGSKLAAEINDIRRDVPIIICSGNIESLSKANLDNIGCLKILAKPVGFKKLDRAIAEIINDN